MLFYAELLILIREMDRVSIIELVKHVSGNEIKAKNKRCAICKKRIGHNRFKCKNSYIFI